MKSFKRFLANRESPANPVLIVAAALLASLLIGGVAIQDASTSKDRRTFAALIDRLSEPGGYFDSDNLISNETSYLHVIGKLRQMGVSGGIYLGVGPDQNFSYIAKIRPRMAIIIDIRRDNLLQHLMFKSMFARSRNRIEYLCMLFGRPLPKDKGWEQRSVRDLVDYIDNTQPDARAFERAAAEIRREVKKYGVPLSDPDFETMARIHKAFFTSGLDIRYSSHYRPPRSIYPTYRDLLLERDLSGQMQNYLNSEDDFRFLKKLHEQDLIVPVVGDFGGTRALKAVGRYLLEINERVSAFYVSNVEFYLVRQGKFEQFIENLKSLPIDDRSVIIRSYFNYNYSPPHPQAIPGHFSTQLLQRIQDLIRQCDGGECESYMDIVTRNSLALQ
jgi:hypothetical protein